MSETGQRLTDLRAFVATVDASGLGNASRVLGLPKSSLSRRLARLEDELGVRLFLRNRQRLALTDEGARLLARARVILDEVDDLVADAAGVQSVPRGRVRASIPLDLAADSAIWLDLIDAYPEVGFELNFTNRYVDVVREGFDVALRAGRGDDQTLIVRRVGHYHLVAVASPDYVGRYGKLETPSDLRVHTCLLLSPMLDRQGADVLPAPHQHLVLDDVHLIHAGVRRGLGIGILPRGLVEPDRAAGALVSVLDAYDPLEVPLYAVYPDRKLLPAAVRVFIDYAAEVFSNKD